MVYFVEDPDKKWELEITSRLGHISIKAHCGLMSLHGASWLVYPPNIIERCFGITFEQKIEKTMRKAQKRVDKLNADIERANQIAGIKPFG